MCKVTNTFNYIPHKLKDTCYLLSNLFYQKPTGHTTNGFKNSDKFYGNI